ncbi:MAG: hypothetical protein M5U01_25515 [Ardenticatenaceae bacterium]|nr:hypothetical protein [Ardenticatenaceae bacterium]
MEARTRTSPPLLVRTPTHLLVGLGLLALAIRVLIALPLMQPGYFDAFYYYHVAQNMAAGRGMVEDLIWNYLDQSPVAMQIPHPSHLYWMPLTTWLAAAGIRLLGGALGGFHAALVPFIVFSAFLPPLSAWVAWHLWQRRDFALRAGLLTLFSGFYFLYWIVPDSYTPFTLAVALSLLGCWLGNRGRTLGWFLAGVGAGLSQLTRADGVLLVLTIPLLAVWPVVGSRLKLEASLSERQPAILQPLNLSLARLLLAGLLAGSGYLAVFGPWLLRNLALAGTPLPGGGIKTLWLRSYDEIFSYQVLLTPHHLLSWGLWPIVRSKGQTLVWNSAILLGTLQFFLAPFAWLGLRQARGRTQVDLLRPVLLYGGVLFVTMTLLFTFPSRRGSLLHSAAALVPWLMALVPAGVNAAAIRFARWRRHDPALAVRFFGNGFVALAALVSLWLYAQALFLPPAPDSKLASWNERATHYVKVAQWLAEHAAAGPVLVVDPPAFTAVTGRPAIVIPSDSLEALTAAADRFGARWLLIESDHAVPLNAAWQFGTPPPGWRHVADGVDALGAPVRLFERAIR